MVRWAESMSYSSLMKLAFSGEGSLFNLGGAGTDISAGNVLPALSGLNTHWQNLRIVTSNQDNISEAAVGMRSLYSFGDEQGKDTYQNLLSGTDRLIVDELLGAEGKTVARDDGRDIYIASLGSSDDRYSQLHVGILLQHEAHRDGVVTSDNGLETERAVLAHTAMALRVAGDVEKKYGLKGRAMVEMLYGTGLRVGELCRLEVRDVDVKERLVFVRSGKGGKDRVVPCLCDYHGGVYPGQP